MNSILFLSTLNLASNPRLVKEIRLALNGGFTVEIICFEFRNWSYEINEQLKKEFRKSGVTIHAIEAGRKPLLPWLVSVCAEMVARAVTVLPIKNIFLLTQAISRRNILLLNALKKIKQVDIVVGHNPGSLAAVLKIKQKFRCKASFDVEDYHPGEGNNNRLQKATRKLMLSILPKLNYVSFAAPLIKEQVEKDVGSLCPNWFTVLNYFHSKEFDRNENIKANKKISFVWFSQNIDYGRGLELIAPFFKKNMHTVELHLFGNPNQLFLKQTFEGLNNVEFHGVVSQTELHSQLAKFDVGLALDIPVDFNRDLALTNKILAYLQAGLYIVATDTKGHKGFLDAHPQHGVLFSYQQNNIETIFEELIGKISFVRNQRNNRIELAKNFNWENQSVSLLKAWSE